MKLVVALGGNALADSPQLMHEYVDRSAKYLSQLILAGHTLIITHGNGPQVGWLEAKTQADLVNCGAMSQGYIGYHLINRLNSYLINSQWHNRVVSLNTEILVDKNDQAFLNPTKPIGSFVSEPIDDSYHYFENKGYRRVVASPKPLKILNLEAIKLLVDNGFVVCCCGGGGVGCILDNQYVGVDVVIDKDLTSSLLATEIEADGLIILTNVEQVCLNYGSQSQVNLAKLTLADAKKYIADNEFGVGSMLPKVEACINFVDKTKKMAFITHLNNIGHLFETEKKTVFVNE